ncbi:MAG: DUF5052 family protein [Atopobiaceae bacterium]|nr:DUF5052 family protein [Atopobiaceae bacterium]
MSKYKKIAIGVGAVAAIALAIVLYFTLSVPGCSTGISDLRGDLVGNSFTITTYDNYGQQTMQTTGRHINVSGNKVRTSGYTETGMAFESWELSSVITITIDGHEMETCGDTCIFVEKGLKPDLDFSAPEFIESHGGSPLSITSLAYTLNQYRNYFGKNRVVVIKSQMGQPIAAYSGNNVYWEVRTDLPKTTKLMIDNKALYIHRANFQIIDTKLLD